MIDTLLNDYKDLIEQRLNECFPDSGCLTAKAARYSLFSGGKRIRPIILLEFYKLCGGNTYEALNFAAAIEMIHTYSLIHDDLPCMDNDDMRRGRPSCHKAYSEDIALLAGDALLTAAFKTASNTSGISERLVLKALSYLSEKSGVNGMIGGQDADLSFIKNPPDEKKLTDMYLKKTSCLLEAAAVAGCILGGDADNTVKNAEIYSESLGIAFQIIDDILDVTASEEVLGKPIGSDEKNQKTTFVTLFGLDGAREKAVYYTERAKTALDNIYGNKDNLIEITDYLLNRKY